MKKINRSRAFWFLFFVLLMPAVVAISAYVAEAFKYERAKMEVEKDESITARLIAESGMSRTEWFDKKRAKCFGHAMVWVKENGPRTNNIGIPYETERETVSFMTDECTRSWNGNSFVPMSEAISNYAKIYWWKIGLAVIAMLLSISLLAWLFVYGAPAAINGFINWITKPESR